MPIKLKQSVFSNRNKEKSATYATANSLKKTRLGGLMGTTKAKISIGQSAQVSSQEFSFQHKLPTEPTTTSTAIANLILNTSSSS